MDRMGTDIFTLLLTWTRSPSFLPPRTPTSVPLPSLLKCPLRNPGTTFSFPIRVGDRSDERVRGRATYETESRRLDKQTPQGTHGRKGPDNRPDDRVAGPPVDTSTDPDTDPATPHSCRPTHTSCHSVTPPPGTRTTQPVSPHWVGPLVGVGRLCAVTGRPTGARRLRYVPKP